MLNPFPLLFLAPVTYFLLRITLGFVCIRTGSQILKSDSASTRKKMLGTLLTFSGTLLMFGIYTQVGAVLTLLLAGLGFVRKGTYPTLSRTSLLFMIAISCTLFITGAGPFGFDMPL